MIMQPTSVIIAAALACVAITSACGMADGQINTNMTRFFIITELGNTFEIAGPPPDRLPGFDSAPYLNTHRLDTSYSLTAGGTAFTPSMARFGQAGSVIALPDHDPARSSMKVVMVTDWGMPSDSKPLYAPFPVGELRMDGTQPYLGPGVANRTASVDVLEWCNVAGYGVSCVDNRAGRDLRVRNTADHGHTADLPAAGRSIIHMEDVKGNLNITGSNLEVFFTCPDCVTQARAYFGVTDSSTTRFLELGFDHGSTLATVPPPYVFGPGGLRGLAWGSVTDPDGITYWQDGSGCTPALSISGNTIHSTCSGPAIQAGTAQAIIWKPLTPGWNSVSISSSGYDMLVMVIDPLSGAKLQIRNGTEQCCAGFDGSIVNRNSRAAVVHDTDRHLLIIPPAGSVSGDHPVLREMHHVRWEAREDDRGTLRWLAHSESGDPIYHGMLYDERGEWPPYKVRLVDAESIRFRAPANDITEYIGWSNYTSADLREIIRITDRHADLLDSEIYDMRNDVQLRTDRGTFVLWDGTHVDRPYIQPWLDVQKSPVWETFGVTLPKDQLLMVDMYATIPVVKPTHLSDTYLSSVPCGPPGDDELDMLWDAMVEAIATGDYDPHLTNFLVYTDSDGPVNDNMRLQQIYLASRTYLDYLDGAYLHGDDVHVPVLPNRPYLCTTISPNVLESQFMVYGLPLSTSYVSLGGTEGTAHTVDPTDPDDAAVYTRTVGVQSPRDGTVSLDITASVSAAVSMLGAGEAHPSRTNATGQWWNGTMSVDVELCIEDDLCKDPSDFIPMAAFDIDLYDVYEEEYLLHGDRCYGRFTTMLDSSPYIVKTVTVPASLGEHIPVTLSLSASGDAASSTGPFLYGSATSLVVFDATTVTDTTTVTESGPITGASLTFNWNDVNGYESIAVYGGGSYNGGTLVSVTAPSGATYTLTPHSEYAGNSHTFDIGFLAGEDMAGTWTVTLHDQGYIPTATGNNRFNNILDSWDLEFMAQTAGMAPTDICDRTEFESMVIQYVLDTFVIDVR